MSAALTESLPADGQKSSWNFRQLACAFIIGFILQMLLLPCLCSIGTAKATFALVLDALIVVRMLIAYFARERGRGWIFYAVALYTSAVWITVLARVVLGPDAW